MALDPDYAFDISQDSVEEDDRTRKLEETAREVVKEKIRGIIKKQFSEAIAAKEKEVTIITDRLSEARHVLDRLRACVVASYYASSFSKPQEKHSVELGAAHHPAIQNVLRKAATAVMSHNTPMDHKQTESRKDETEMEMDTDNTMDHHDTSDSKEIEGISKMNESELSENNERKSPQKTQKSASKENLGGRHRIKKTIIVGNVSKYIAPDKREGNDKSTHKWMVYVRGSAHEPRIDHFVRKVWFFLHPSYRPNDLVEVSEAPFHLTRRGWGEFPVRVQLHFCDPRNRRVDIIHNLRLDRTYTGLQTLGAETVCEVELDRSTVGLPVENLLDQAVASQMSVTNCDDSESGVNKSDQTTTSKADDSSEKTASVVDASVNHVVQDVVDEIVRKISKEVKCSSSEEMDVEEEIVEEDNRAFASEKRRRRRRGDSCCVADKEEKSKKTKSMAMMILCPDEEMDEVDVEEKQSTAASPTSTDSLEQDNLKDSDDAEITLKIEDEHIIDKLESKSSLPSKPVSTRSSPEKNLASQETLNSARSASDRPRSLSVDSGVSPSAALSVAGGKLLRISKPAANKDILVPKVNPQKSSVVVLRPRSSSTGISQKFSQTTKGNVTIFTPIGSKTAKSPSFSGQKRPIGQVSASSCGRIVLNVLPEKKQKLTNPAAQGATTSKITLSLNKQKAEVPIHDSSLRGGVPGTTAVRRPSIKFENSGKKDSNPAKSYILKNTKQGLVVVGQNLVVKDSTQPKVVKTPNCSSQEKDANAPPSNPLSQCLQSGDESAKSKVSKATEGARNKSQVALTALKNAILGSDVGNRSVQIKIEKSSGCKSLSQLKNNQQYVLTTVTNEQGKQQLALVSADRMKQSLKAKDFEKKQVSSQDPCLDQAPFLIKLDSDQSTWSSNRLTNNGNRPYHEAIAFKILSFSSVRHLVKDVLPLAVRHVPLVSSEASPTHLPFCAKSEDDFLEWNIGKQRAAELQRAALIQKILKHVQEHSTSLESVEIPSKRFIMNWCLMRGYSVFTDEYESSEIEEAPESDSTLTIPSSLTPHNAILRTLEENPNGISNARDEEDFEVDVVSVSPPPKTVKSEPQSQTNVSEQTKYRFAYTDEMRTVDTITQEIGLRFQDLPVTEDVHAPLCQVILAKAMELFVSHLSREALAASLTRRDGASKIQRVQPDIVECRDVADAVRDNGIFQLFSDKDMACSNEPLDNT